MRKAAKMNGNRTIIFTWLLMIILVACTPSGSAIPTAMPQTQEAYPTLTFTPCPPTETSTRTPTEAPTGTPSPAFDLLSLQGILKEFLMQKSNLPLLANYTPYFDSPVNVSNESFSQRLGSNGAEYLAETGRMDGWEVYVNYEGDPSLAISPLRLYSNVSLFKTVEGAQLAITKDSDRYGTEYGFTEDIDPPGKIGDVTRVYYKRVQDKPDSNQYSLEYIIDFSYRNVFQTVQESGLDRNVDPIFLMDIAQRLLAKLQASPLINP